MNQPIRSRRIVALIAAYVIALEVLLLPLSVAAGTALDFSLCAVSSHAMLPPGGHGTSCRCAAACGIQRWVQVPASSPQAIIVLGRVGVRISPPQAIAAIERPYIRSPQLARAPPVA